MESERKEDPAETFSGCLGSESTSGVKEVSKQSVNS